MEDSVRQQLLFEANRKSTGAAYLLWFFLGTLGAHRFYLGRTTSAVVQLLLLLFGWVPLFVGWVILGIWWVIDAFLIPDIIRAHNLRTIQDLSDGRTYRLRS